MDKFYDANHYLEIYEKEKSIFSEDNLWLKNFREKAFATLKDSGFPSIAQEEWRHTNLKHLSTIPFALNNNTIETEELSTSLQTLKPQLVFIDGILSEELSCFDDLPTNIYISSLKNALEDYDSTLEKIFSSSDNMSSLEALNTLFLQKGSVIVIPDNHNVASPIHCLYVTTKKANNTFSAITNVFILGKNSKATLVEHYVGEENISYFTSTSTKILLTSNAQLTHITIQEESAKAYHLAETKVFQASYSHYEHIKMDVGGQLVRNTHKTHLRESGATCHLLGLYLGGKRQLVDNHTTISHESPNTDSSEYYKGILWDKAQGIFHGKVFVKPHAIKVNAKQQNKNLLLSEDAVATTQPQLEIYADDVQCAHGATVSTFDEDSLFYLRSRGLCEKEAKNLITMAFAQDILAFLPKDALGDYIKTRVKETLPTTVKEEEMLL